MRDLPGPDGPGGPADGPGPDPRERLGTTGPGALTGWLVAGLVVGWAVRPVTEELGGSVPVLGWTQPLAVWLLAAILGGTAWSTWRAVHVQRVPVEPHRAVNRLVLAKACALVGAVLAGAYAGHALSWVGLGAETADTRILRAAVAAVAGAVVVVASLLLERACRVRSDPPDA